MQRALIYLAISVALAACASVRQPHFGVREGALAPCAQIQGCVSSQAADPEQRVEPMRYDVTRQEAKAILLTVLNDTHGLTVVSNHRNYVRVELREESMDDFPGASAVIDDVEFYLDPTSRVIHLRAEPRLSRPDAETNRARLEALNQRFEALHERYHRQNPLR